jgi:hypothetical protein
LGNKDWQEEHFERLIEEMRSEDMPAVVHKLQLAGCGEEQSWDEDD